MSDPKPVCDSETMRAFESEIERKAREAASKKTEQTEVKPDESLENSSFGQALRRAGWFEG